MTSSKSAYIYISLPRLRLFLDIFPNDITTDSFLYFSTRRKQQQLLPRSNLPTTTKRNSLLSFFLEKQNKTKQRKEKRRKEKRNRCLYSDVRWTTVTTRYNYSISNHLDMETRHGKRARTNVPSVSFGVAACHFRSPSTATATTTTTTMDRRGERGEGEGEEEGEKRTEKEKERKVVAGGRSRSAPATVSFQTIHGGRVMRVAWLPAVVTPPACAHRAASRRLAPQDEASPTMHVPLSRT